MNYYSKDRISTARAGEIIQEESNFAKHSTFL